MATSGYVLGESVGGVLGLMLGTYEGLSVPGDKVIGCFDGGLLG